MSKYDYKNVAYDYDQLVRKHNWQAPELIYVHLHPFIQKNSKLLDIGVGTGISSERFYAKQVELYGLDNSPDLIAVCKSKMLFKEVRLFDLQADTMPYPDCSFEFVICSGVLHFFGDLETIFRKTSSILKTRGFFAFTIIEHDNNAPAFSLETNNGIEVYRHSNAYIQSLTNKVKLRILEEETFSTIKDLKTYEKLDHKLIIAQKD